MYRGVIPRGMLLLSQIEGVSASLYILVVFCRKFWERTGQNYKVLGVVCIV